MSGREYLLAPYIVSRSLKNFLPPPPRSQSPIDTPFLFTLYFSGLQNLDDTPPLPPPGVVQFWFVGFCGVFVFFFFSRIQTPWPFLFPREPERRNSPSPPPPVFSTPIFDKFTARQATLPPSSFFLPLSPSRPPRTPPWGPLRCHQDRLPQRRNCRRHTDCPPLI